MVLSFGSWPWVACRLLVDERDGAARAHTFLESTTGTSLVANGAGSLPPVSFGPELSEAILQGNGQECLLWPGSKGQRGNWDLRVPFLRMPAPLHVEQSHVGTGSYRHIAAIGREDDLGIRSKRPGCDTLIRSTTEGEESQLLILEAGTGQAQVRSHRKGKLQIFCRLLALTHALWLFAST